MAMDVPLYAKSSQDGYVLKMKIVVSPDAVMALKPAMKNVMTVTLTMAMDAPDSVSAKAALHARRVAANAINQNVAMVSSRATKHATKANTQPKAAAAINARLKWAGSA